MNKEEINSKNTVKQEQIHNLLFSKEIEWQEIIYDLINTEQLDPWDLDITLLTERYLEEVERYEEANFFISSKVLLAAALLLRIKTEFLLNRYIKSIDEILFGKTEEKKHVLERIELEEEIPELVPKSPMPRFKKVTLKELIESLNKAIATENRRIKKELINKRAFREATFAIPKKKFNIKNKIREIYERLFMHFEKNQEKKKISFTEFIGINKEERIISFLPLLHLEDQKKVWLEQDDHFDEIYIWLKKTYLKENPNLFTDLKQESEIGIEKLDNEKKKRLKKINEEFSNPVGE